MALLKNEYKSFLDDIEKNIKNKDDLKYIKERFASFMDVVLDQIDYIMDYKEEKIVELKKTKKELDEKYNHKDTDRHKNQQPNRALGIFISPYPVHLISTSS